MGLEKNSAGIERFGRDVTLRALYFRHAEKASGSVGSGSQVSSSLISPRGKMQSKSLGASFQSLPGSPKETTVKIRSSLQPRTHETALATGYGSEPLPDSAYENLTEDDIRTWEHRRRAVMQSRGIITRTATGQELEEAYKKLPFNQQVEIAEESASLIDSPVPRAKWELSADTQPKDYFKIYVEKWEANKNRIMIERGIDPKDFSKLSSKEQAEIAEPAEESVAAEWLDNPGSEMARLFPLEVAAAQIAVQVRRDAIMARRLKSGSAVDLFNNTHRTMTEPLLMKMLVLPDGKKPEKLAEIGGLLGLNDGFELRIKTNNSGVPETRLFMYRVKDRGSDHPEYEQTEYQVDMDELNRLADQGLEMKKNQQ